MLMQRMVQELLEPTDHNLDLSRVGLSLLDWIQSQGYRIEFFEIPDQNWIRAELTTDLKTFYGYAHHGQKDFARVLAGIECFERACFRRTQARIHSQAQADQEIEVFHLSSAKQESIPADILFGNSGTDRRLSTGSAAHTQVASAVEAGVLEIWERSCLEKSHQEQRALRKISESTLQKIAAQLQLDSPVGPEWDWSGYLENSGDEPPVARVLLIRKSAAEPYIFQGTGAGWTETDAVAKALRECAQIAVFDQRAWSHGTTIDRAGVNQVKEVQLPEVGKKLLAQLESRSGAIESDLLEDSIDPARIASWIKKGQFVVYPLEQAGDLWAIRIHSLALAVPPSPFFENHLD
jgi:ribosomal protein S12 methylthiotransferase accessory factor YcaO